jgi:BolA protein
MIDEEIKHRLNMALSPSYIELVDESAKHAGHAGARSGGKHFILKVASPAFRDKSLQEQHRMIYQAMGDLMVQSIHALSIEIIKESV